MKVADLSDAELEYWAARADGYSHEQIVRMKDQQSWSVRYLDWVKAGPIIEREKMHGGPAGTGPDGATWFFQCYRKDAAGTHIPYPCSGSGTTPLIAAMRAYVASKFGEEVPDQK